MRFCISNKLLGCCPACGSLAHTVSSKTIEAEGKFSISAKAAVIFHLHLR